MEVKKTNRITIVIEGDEAKDFEAALSKISKGDTKVGFSKEALTENEQKIIKEVYKKI